MLGRFTGLFIRRIYRRYDITARLYSRQSKQYRARCVNRSYYVCFLCCSERWTFNSLKSAGEQSTEYNSLRLIYLVRFILFACPFFPPSAWSAPRASRDIAKKIVSEREFRWTSNGGLLGLQTSLSFSFSFSPSLYINVVNYERLCTCRSRSLASVSRKCYTVSG